MIRKMIDKAVDDQVKSQNIQKDEANIYRYGYMLLYETVVNVVLACLVGIISHEPLAVFVFLIVYIPLRSFCGGWHASKIWKCTIISTVIIILEALLVRFLVSYMGSTLFIGAFAIGILAAIVMAPVESQAKKISAEEHRLYKKKIIVIILCHAVILTLMVICKKKMVVASMAYSYVIQAVMLLLGKASQSRKK